MQKFLNVALAAILGLVLTTTAYAGERFITVASTTSTQNSGLFAYLLPLFESKTGIKVHVVAVGTGQAIRLAEKGDVDVLFVHHKKSEEKFVKDGFGVRRFGVMYNDFVIVGPPSDPAEIGGMTEATKAFAKIATAKAPFASRGDNSGTNKKELSLWKAASVNQGKASGGWYRETGSGMGATLNTAVAMGAYTLVDRGTWLSFKNKANMKVLVEGDPRLFNPYGVILVNPKKHSHVKAAEGQAFIDWLTSAEGQKAIGAFTIDGKQLFKPNANSKGNA